VGRGPGPQAAVEHVGGVAALDHRGIVDVFAVGDGQRARHDRRIVDRDIATITPGDRRAAGAGQRPTRPAAATAGARAAGAGQAARAGIGAAARAGTGAAAGAGRAGLPTDARAVLTT